MNLASVLLPWQQPSSTALVLLFVHRHNNSAPVDNTRVRSCLTQHVSCSLTGWFLGSHSTLLSLLHLLFLITDLIGHKTASCPVPGLLPGPLMGVQTAAFQVLLIEDNLQTLLSLSVSLFHYSFTHLNNLAVATLMCTTPQVLLWIAAAVLITWQRSSPSMQWSFWSPWLFCCVWIDRNKQFWAFPEGQRTSSRTISCCSLMTSCLSLIRLVCM